MSPSGPTPLLAALHTDADAAFDRCLHISRQRLLRGMDAIAYTLDAAARIDAFEKARFAACPWARLN